ncbi:MAG: hypothetical protein ABIA04_07215 [Pseudomonadota bacterium]
MKMLISKTRIITICFILLIPLFSFSFHSPLQKDANNFLNSMLEASHTIEDIDLKAIFIREGIDFLIKNDFIEEVNFGFNVLRLIYKNSNQFDMANLFVCEEALYSGNITEAETCFQGLKNSRFPEISEYVNYYLDSFPQIKITQKRLASIQALHLMTLLVVERSFLRIQHIMGENEEAALRRKRVLEKGFEKLIYALNVQAIAGLEEGIERFGEITSIKGQIDMQPYEGNRILQMIKDLGLSEAYENLVEYTNLENLIEREEKLFELINHLAPTVPFPPNQVPHNAVLEIIQILKRSQKQKEKAEVLEARMVTGDYTFWNISYPDFCQVMENLPKDVLITMAGAYPAGFLGRYVVARFSRLMVREIGSVLGVFDTTAQRAAKRLLPKAAGFLAESSIFFLVTSGIYSFKYDPREVFTWGNFAHTMAVLGAFKLGGLTFHKLGTTRLARLGIRFESNIIRNIGNASTRNKMILVKDSGIYLTNAAGSFATELTTMVGLNALEQMFHGTSEEDFHLRREILKAGTFLMALKAGMAAGQMTYDIASRPQTEAQRIEKLLSKRQSLTAEEFYMEKLSLLRLFERSVETIQQRQGLRELTESIALDSPGSEEALKLRADQTIDRVGVTMVQRGMFFELFEILSPARHNIPDNAEIGLFMFDKSGQTDINRTTSEAFGDRVLAENYFGVLNEISQRFNRYIRENGYQDAFAMTSNLNARGDEVAIVIHGLAQPVQIELMNRFLGEYTSGFDSSLPPVTRAYIAPKAFRCGAWFGRVTKLAPENGESIDRFLFKADTAAEEAEVGQVLVYKSGTAIEYRDIAEFSERITSDEIDARGHYEPKAKKPQEEMKRLRKQIAENENPVLVMDVVWRIGSRDILRGVIEAIKKKNYKGFGSIMLDLINFNVFNTVYGHDGGNVVMGGLTSAIMTMEANIKAKWQSRGVDIEVYMMRPDTFQIEIKGSRNLDPRTVDEISRDIIREFETATKAKLNGDNFIPLTRGIVIESKGRNPETFPELIEEAFDFMKRTWRSVDKQSNRPTLQRWETSSRAKNILYGRLERTTNILVNYLKKGGLLRDPMTGQRVEDPIMQELCDYLEIDPVAHTDLKGRDIADLTFHFRFQKPKIIGDIIKWIESHNSSFDSKFDSQYMPKD